MKITRYGHAAVLVEAAGARILIDPGTFATPETFELDGLDAIVVTHQHPDHIDADRAPGLLTRNRDAVLIADPESAASLGFGDWIPNAAGLTTEVGGLTLTGVGERHAVVLPDLPRVANVGVIVHSDGEPRLFHPGDTYEYVPDGVDVLAVPLTAPWAKASEAVDFVRAVSPGIAFPIHDCTASEAGQALYWSHISTFGGAGESRRLGQRDSTDATL